MDSYDLEGIAAWVRTHEFKTVAVQMPPELLRSAAALSASLARLAPGASFCILGEGRCCPDEVDSMRYGCDAVVQLGRSCFGPARRLPVLHALARSSAIDAAHLASSLGDILADRTAALTVVIDLDHIWAAPKVQAELEALGFNRLCVASARVAGDTRPGFGPWALSDYGGEGALVYAGDDDGCESALRLSVPHARYVRYSVSGRSATESSEQRARMIRRRLAPMRGACSASAIAIVLAASPSDRSVRSAARLREVCARCGVKTLEVAAGKVNEYKLSNFCDAVSAFALASCPLALEYLDSRDYPMPFVSAFELETGLIQGDAWAGDYTTDFEAYLASRGISLAAECEKAPMNELLH